MSFHPSNTTDYSRDSASLRPIGFFGIHSFVRSYFIHLFMDLFTANIKVNLNDLVRSRKAEKCIFRPKRTTNNLSFCGMKNDARLFAFTAINYLLVIIYKVQMARMGIESGFSSYELICVVFYEAFR